MTEDVWGQLRRQVGFFTALGGPAFAAYTIQHSTTLEGVVVGVPLLAAGGFALASLIAWRGRRAVVRTWIALGFVVFAVLAEIVFAVLEG